MTDHEHAEISRRLALAIGHRIDDVQMVMAHQGSPALCEVWHYVSPKWAKWKEFDYRDPAVIWPIAERFEAFPRSSITGSVWLCRTSSEHRFEMADTAALAVARAVIAAKEKA
jgi:hypothetical protein